MSQNPDADLDYKPQKFGSGLPWTLFVLLLIAAAVGAWLGWGAYGTEQAATRSARTAAQEAEARVKLLEGEKSALEVATKMLQAEKGLLEGEVKDKDAELAKLKATYDTLEDKMKQEIQNGEIKLSQAGGKIQVDLVDKILFDSGRAELSTRGTEVLSRVGAVLAKVEDKAIQVSGHTDDSPPSDRLTGTFPTNWELSTARAVNVVRFLAEKASVPSKRLVAAGYGQFHPLATNANPAGRARNRRIEILLTPALDAKPSNVLAEAALAPSASRGTSKPAVTKGPARKPVVAVAHKKTRHH
jgi:chemotaxis protein MotB